MTFSIICNEVAISQAPQWGFEQNINLICNTAKTSIILTIYSLGFKYIVRITHYIYTT